MCKGTLCFHELAFHPHINIPLPILIDGETGAEKPITCSRFISILLPNLEFLKKPLLGKRDFPSLRGGKNMNQ